MDRPHHPQQKPELHRSNTSFPTRTYVKVRANPKLSQQPPRGIGGITAKEQRFRSSNGSRDDIRGLLMDPVTNTPIVIFEDVAGESVLASFLGGGL